MLTDQGKVRGYEDTTIAACSYHLICKIFRSNKSKMDALLYTTSTAVSFISSS
jgi:hypothetical protein